MRYSTTLSVACIAAVSGLAFGDLYFDISGIESRDFQGDPDNERFILAGGSAFATAGFDLSWDVNLTTLGISWAQEATIGISDAFGNSVYIRPGAGDAFTVSNMNYQGSGGSASSLMFDEFGYLYLEIFETDWDDNPDEADAIFEDGSIVTIRNLFPSDFELTLIPVPAPGGIFAVGLGLLLGCRRAR